MKRSSAISFLVFFGGLLLTTGGILIGYTMGYGLLRYLFTPPWFVIIGSFVVGSVVISFGFLQPARMFADAFRGVATLHPRHLQTNTLICECASRAAVFGGAVAFLLGALITCDSLGAGDLIIGANASNALVAPVAGLILSRLLFRPLKARFLEMQSGSSASLEMRSLLDAKTMGKLLLGAILLVILIFVTASFLDQIGHYMNTIMR